MSQINAQQTDNSQKLVEQNIRKKINNGVIVLEFKRN